MTFTVASSDNLGFSQSQMGDTNSHYSLLTNTPFTFIYTYTANDPSDSWSFGNFSAGGATASCTPSPSGQTDSLNIRSLQDSITPLVATISGQAITNAIDGGINDAFYSNGAPITFGPSGGFINFFAEPAPKSQSANHAEDAFAMLNYARDNNKVSDKKSPSLLDNPWSAWADIRGTGWQDDDKTGGVANVKGNQLNLTVGIGRKLTDNTLIGVIGGYENFKYDVAPLIGSLKGDGLTIGGYFAQRFADLRFDTEVAWSDLRYDATAGTAVGSFTGSRWLVSAGLTGYYEFNHYVVAPSAKVYVLWESEKAWTDSVDNQQPSRDFSTGRTALGARVGRTFEISNGLTLSPYVGLYGDWTFQSDNAFPTTSPIAAIGTGWAGRVNVGVVGKAAGECIISLDGEYGGLGANYKIWTGNVRLSMPF